MTVTDPMSLPGIELLRSLMTTPLESGEAGASARPGIGRLLGMTVGEIEVGEVSFTVTTRADFSNPLGTTHGGICSTLLDSAMGCAVHSTLEAGVGYGTLELKVNFVRSVPVSGVTLTATGRVIHSGRTTATAEGRVVDDQGRLVAHGTTTCIIHR